MSDVGFKVGIACLSGAYMLANMATLYWLISLQKNRQQAENRKKDEQDPFFDKYQEVIDLVCLMNLNLEDAQKALLDNNFKTPISEKILTTLKQTDKPDWQRIYLSWETRKSSYDDLMMIQVSLKEKKMPYCITVRKNPIRNKKCNDILLSRECISTSRGHLHQDLIRHRISQLNSVHSSD